MSEYAFKRKEPRDAVIPFIPDGKIPGKHCNQQCAAGEDYVIH